MQAHNKTETMVPSKKEFIVFGAPDIREAEIQEVVSTLKSGWIGTGPKVKKFEKKFAEYKNIPFENTVALSSCTAALHLALLASNIKAGDEVITTATTFCSTINAIIHSGATPVLVDIDPNTLNIDANKIEASISKNTKAIIPVHMAGNPCEMDEILEIANKHNLLVIEDCAHSIESEYKGKKLGTMGDFGCFSFYTTKNLVTAEGGMLIGKDEKIIDISRTLSLHGMDLDAWKRFGGNGYKHYSIVFPGYKYNMTDINASLGIHQLARIEESWSRRKSIYEYYLNKLDNLPIKLPTKLKEDTKHAYHLFVIQIDEKLAKLSRDEFILKMNEEKIGTGVHYRSAAEHPLYINMLNLNSEYLNSSITYGRQTVSLPLYVSLEDNQVERIVDTVIKIFSR